MSKKQEARQVVPKRQSSLSGCVAWFLGRKVICSNYRIVCCGVGIGSLHRLHPMPDYIHSMLAKVAREMLVLLTITEHGTSTDPVCPADY
jgi:hypothetical protein